jgi:hypothetical protein
MSTFLCIASLLISEYVNQSLWKLVRISWRLIQSQRHTP